jgi:hypothetical protein
MHRVTVKTSTVFISKGGKTQVYRSVDHVPAGLREELEKSTNGFNSATILIADKRGREEIVRALNGLPSGLRSRLASRLETERAPVRAPRLSAHRAVRFFRRNWLEIALPALAGGVVWMAFSFR